jgi:hypothetical protein
LPIFETCEGLLPYKLLEVQMGEAISGCEVGSSLKALKEKVGQGTCPKRKDRLPMTMFGMEMMQLYFWGLIWKLNTYLYSAV